MKRIIIFIILGMLSGMGDVVPGEEVSGPAETVQQFFTAAQKGDIETMRSRITGPFFNRRKALIENNPEYPEFLREQFSGIDIAIISATIENNDALASVTVEWLYPNGSAIQTAYLLHKSEENGEWKIFDERLVE